jgi:hypothetical protein
MDVIGALIRQIHISRSTYAMIGHATGKQTQKFSFVHDTWIPQYCSCWGHPHVGASALVNGYLGSHRRKHDRPPVQAPPNFALQQRGAPLQLVHPSLDPVKLTFFASHCQPSFTTLIIARGIAHLARHEVRNPRRCTCAPSSNPPINARYHDVNGN